MKKTKAKIEAEKVVLRERLKTAGRKIMKLIFGALEQRFPGHARTEPKWQLWANRYESSIVTGRGPDSRRMLELIISPEGSFGSLVEPDFVRCGVVRSRTIGGIPPQRSFTLKRGKKVSLELFAGKAALKIGALMEVELAAEKANTEEREKHRENARLAETVVADLHPTGEEPKWWSVRKYESGYRVQIDATDLTRGEARLLFRGVQAILETKVSADTDDLKVAVSGPNIQGFKTS